MLQVIFFCKHCTRIRCADAVSDISSKIAAQIASDDLADIVLFSNNDLMQSAITAKELLLLDDLIAKYGQDLMEKAPLMLDYSRTRLSIDKNGKLDGNTYILGGRPIGPYYYDPIQTTTLPWARYDLYKKQVMEFNLSGGITRPGLIYDGSG